MRISDWSSDVCSSDLPEPPSRRGAGQRSSRGSSRLMRFSTTSLSLAALTLVAVTMAAVGLLAGAAAGQSSDDAQTSDDAQSDDTGAVDWEKQTYIIRDGKVDDGTYNGFSRYHYPSHTHHGPDPLRSSYAPPPTDYS